MRLYSYKDPFHFRWIIHKSCWQIYTQITLNIL